MKQYKSTSRAFAHEMRNESTFSEVLLWMQLRASKLGYPFKRQVPIGNYIVDFYCPSLRLAVFTQQATQWSMMMYVQPHYKVAE